MARSAGYRRVPLFGAARIHGLAFGRTRADGRILHIVQRIDATNGQPANVSGGTLRFGYHEGPLR